MTKAAVGAMICTAAAPIKPVKVRPSQVPADRPDRPTTNTARTAVTAPMTTAGISKSLKTQAAPAAIRTPRPSASRISPR